MLTMRFEPARPSVEEPSIEIVLEAITALDGVQMQAVLIDDDAFNDVLPFSVAGGRDDRYVVFGWNGLDHTIAIGTPGATGSTEMAISATDEIADAYICTLAQALDAAKYFLEHRCDSPDLEWTTSWLTVSSAESPGLPDRQ
jgi:hypothetical protein